MIKKFFGLGLVLAFVLAPSLASAAQIETGQQYLLAAGEQAAGNLYVAAGHASIAGTVVGDLYVSAGSAVVAGRVLDDLVVLGGNVTLTGEVAGDVRVFGGNVTVAGPVHGDLFVMGGTLAVDSLVVGDVDFIGGALNLGDETRIGGDLSYRTDRPAVLGEQAVVMGKIIHDENLARQLGVWRDFNRTSVLAGLTALLGAWLFLKLLMLLFAGLVVYWLMRDPAEKIIRRSLERPGRSLLLGFVTAISAPVLGLILALTIIGLPLVALLAVVYLTIMIWAKITSGILVGWWLDQVILKPKRARFTWVTVAAGVAILFVVSRLPIIGWLICGVVTLIIFGTVIDLLVSKWRTLNA